MNPTQKYSHCLNFVLIRKNLMKRSALHREMSAEKDEKDKKKEKERKKFSTKL